jgi:hypothetical protein
MRLIALLFLAVLFSANFSLAQSTYKRPVDDVVRIVEAKATPGVSINPTKEALLLTDYNPVRELISEWNRFEDFDTARSNKGGLQPMGMDIGWIGKGIGKVN